MSSLASRYLDVLAKLCQSARIQPHTYMATFSLKYMQSGCPDNQF